jgi:hypothetical protein
VVAALGETVDILEDLARIPEVNLHSDPAVAALAVQDTVVVKDYIQHRVVEAAEAAPE